MTPEQQRTFIGDLILTIRTKILNADIPVERDGIELRQYIAEQVCDMSRTRRRDYRNNILTRNL